MAKKGKFKDLIKYTVAQMKRRRYATAHAFWVFAFENFLEEAYKKVTGSEPDPNLTNREITDLLGRRGYNWRQLKNLNWKRNQIIHNAFINEDESGEFSRLTEELGYVIFNDKKSLKERKEEIDTELALE